MPRSILHVGMCFFDTVLIMHKPTNELAFFVCFFGSRDMTDTTIRKNTKAAIICLKKEKEKMASFPFVCICGSNTRLKFQIETRKIERGSNATCPHHYLFNVWESFRAHTSWWVQNWAVHWYRSSPCVFRTVYTNFHLDRERRFLELTYRFVGQNVAKSW